MKEITTNNLLPGDIILCTPNILKIDGWIGQAIVLFTGGLASHTALYCGQKAGIGQIAHSNLAGTHYDTLDFFQKNHAGFFVRRHTGRRDLTAVLAAVDNYMHNDKPDPYPIANLVVLGLLILSKKLMAKTLTNKIFYDFLMLATVKLMKQINEKYYTKNAMTCSQFAAQCYTDAGGGRDYNIEFDKLYVQFELENSCNQKLSLLDMLEDDEDLQSFNAIDIVENIHKQADKYLRREIQIVDQFMAFINNDPNLSSSTETVSHAELAGCSQALLTVIHKVKMGYDPLSVKEALAMCNTDRNFLVTPDDLLFNASNLTDVGYVGRQLF